jgi:predicted Zn-dependent peptidase
MGAAPKPIRRPAHTNVMEAHKEAIGNGVRVLTDPTGHVGSAAIGLWCQTGSRHENEDEAGITHLIEHMLFKGTRNRTAKEIAETIEGRGGHLNAFTDKEATCYYCRVLADDVPIAVDVLADMMKNSLIEPSELELEKGVVLEEIKRAEDEPSDHVHDLHLQGRRKGHPLGRPVIGTRESVGSFDRAAIQRYMARRYLGGNIVLAAAGRVDPAQVRHLAETHLGDLPSGGGSTDCERPVGGSGTEYVAKDIEAVHFCIGGDGVSVYDPDLYVCAVLDGILGGGMSSRLFQEVREKRGLAYAIGSYSVSYSAGGAFTVYGGTGKKTWDEVQALVRQEMDRVVRGELPEEELERVKRSICGHLVIALEGMSARMMRLSRNELIYGRYVPVEETVANINAVTVSQVAALAERLLDRSSVSTTAIGPP